MYSDFLLSTASTLEGYRIVRQCGVVFGETVFKHSFLDNLSASISNTIDSFSLRGKEMSGSVDLIETAREYAYKKMIAEAKQRRANAIIAIESDNTIGNNIMYISLYGTAVQVMKEEEYEKYVKSEKEKLELEQRKQAEMVAKVTQRLQEINDMKEKGESTPELLFLTEIINEETIMGIAHLWMKYDLCSLYPEIDKKIKDKMSMERSYGRSPKETQRFIQYLNEALNK